MNHFVMDAFQDIVPLWMICCWFTRRWRRFPKLGLKAVMPPFILPYYNGVVPEDCGISAFSFWAAGILDSYFFISREAYFVDLLSPGGCWRQPGWGVIGQRSFSRLNGLFLLSGAGRPGNYPAKIGRSMKLWILHFTSFGTKNYSGPKSMDGLFGFSSVMPFDIGMTPIMRPIAVKKLGQRGKSDLRFGDDRRKPYQPACITSKNPNRLILTCSSCKFFDYG